MLAVNRAVTEEIERLQSVIPKDIKVDVNIDFSIFIREELKEVLQDAGRGAGRWCWSSSSPSSGSLRATLIPAVTIPVAIIASFLVMAALGYSVNTLTLLGMVLAIGLVVDDAIVVLENVVRRMELGQPPLLAAIDGTREIGFAVIATTAVLVAVFVPISFMPGNVGRLFTEFGITLAAAIAFSGLVSLTLVPMLTSKLFAGRHQTAARLRAPSTGSSSGSPRPIAARCSPTLRRPAVALGVLAAVAATGAAALQHPARPNTPRSRTAA